MAFIVRPNLSPPPISSGGLQQQQQHHHHHHQWPTKSALLLLNNTFNFSAAALVIPPVRVAQLNQPPPLSPPPPEVQDPDTDNNNNSNKKKNKEQSGRRDEFYVNLGLAVRTLREDLPLLFSRDLNYQIYRDDITFLDPLNRFTGIDNYRLIFWALRFHGRILFSDISLEIYRVWQPSENVILIRWNLRGVPRVPWEAKGEFQGTSRYKVDRTGKIYEHKVDNLAFNFPTTRVSVLDLVAASACPPSPNPTFSSSFPPLSQSSYYYSSSSSWLDLYVAIRNTLVDHHHPSLHCLATCSS